MPRQISPDVKDLIKRMLQTNPVKRITLNEIKQHRWFLTDLPAYLHDLSRASLRNDTQVDKDLVRHLMSVSKIFDFDDDLRLTKGLRSHSMRSAKT